MVTHRAKLRWAGAAIFAAALCGGWNGSNVALAQPAWRGPSDGPNAGASLPSGRTLAEAKCAACHGIDGNSTDPQYPKIAGQNPYYIRLQLRAFKSGARRSDIMSGIASSLSESEIASLARHFSAQRVKPDTVNDRRLADIGERIFHYPGAGVPPCVACHGDGGFGPGFGRGGMMGGGMMGGRGGMMGGHMGMMMGYAGVAPNLYGQHAAYIVRQLAAFARGERRSNVMGPIAASWSAQDRRAVAEYLSGLR